MEPQAMDTELGITSVSPETQWGADAPKSARAVFARYIKEGANVAVLEPDVANAFRDSASVNAALRSLLEVSEATRRLTTRSKRGPRKHVAA